MHHFRHKLYRRSNSYWLTVLYTGFIALGIGLLAFYTQNGFLKFLNFVAWCVVAFKLYKNIFYWVNSIDMSDDLKFIGVRIIGGIVGALGFFIGGLMFFASLAAKNDPISMGVSILFLGAGCLGGFMLFRSNRRYGHLYVNR